MCGKCWRRLSDVQESSVRAEGCGESSTSTFEADEGFNNFSRVCQRRWTSEASMTTACDDSVMTCVVWQGRWSRREARSASSETVEVGRGAEIERQ